MADDEEFWTPPADVDLERFGRLALDAAASQAPELRARAIEAVNAGEAEAGEDGEGWIALWVDGSKLMRVHRSAVLRVPDSGVN